MLNYHKTKNTCICTNQLVKVIFLSTIINIPFKIIMYLIFNHMQCVSLEHYI